MKCDNCNKQATVHLDAVPARHLSLEDITIFGFKNVHLGGDEFGPAIVIQYAWFVFRFLQSCFHKLFFPE